MKFTKETFSSKTATVSFIKKLEKFFIVLMILPLSYMAYNWYEKKSFKQNPISVQTQNRVLQAEQKVLGLIHEKFNLNPQISLIISDEFHSNLYGLTTYKDGFITIYLNKKRFKESEEYMIKEVIPHEYAHAMVFVLGKKTSKDGHTKDWQKVCFALDGKQCIQYVDNEAIVKEKMNAIFR